MSMPEHRRMVSRRSFLTGTAGAVVASYLGGRELLAGHPARAAGAVAAGAPTAAPYRSGRTVRKHLVGTDGWAAMPPDAKADPPFFPDALAPAPFNTYIFGFRDVTGLTDNQVIAQRGRAQISAPLLGFDEGDDIYVTLSNLGMLVRPDLADGHTLHWHGFKDQIPLFDGVPELSIAVPIGRDFTYFYRPHDPGTYMYHCHFEDVEHVQMGMSGMVFVRPKQNTGEFGQPVGKYAYNDGDGSTRYDREFAVFLSEIWSAAHFRDAHIQTSDWTDYEPSFHLMNGRAYPDTIAPPGGGADPSTGDLIAPAGFDRLRYQPHSTLITANAGERILLRIASLGYRNHNLTSDGIDLTVVAKDTNLLVGRDSTRAYLTSNSVDVGPGESRDVLFTAPDRPGTYLLYDHSYANRSNGGGAGYGGQLTEIRVGAPGTYGPQTAPNT